MNKTIIFFLACYGITNIVTTSHIFEPLRQALMKRSPDFFGKLIQCSMCFGFWAGAAVSWAGLYSHKLGITLINPFMDACASSAVCWILYTATEWLYQNTAHEEDQAGSNAE